MKICIFGASSEIIEKGYIDQVEAFGEKMAKRGHSLVFGCGAHGLMGASARGVKKGGGFVHGVIPKFFEDNGYKAIFYEADKLTWTKTMAERKTTMENDCEAFVIVPGGVGTFEELFEIITLKQLCQLDKPIAIYNINGYYDKLNEFLVDIVKKRFVSESTMQLFKFCNSSNEVFDYIESYYKIPRKKLEFKKTN